MMKPEKKEPTTENKAILNIPYTLLFSILDIISGFIMLAKGFAFLTVLLK